MITDKEYRKIGVGVLKVGVVAFAIGVLTGYFIFN
jgi:hypothetical protein